MKRNILVTGARSPAALEICRGLNSEGCSVYAADSILFPISKYSNSVLKTFKIASPREDPKTFIEDINYIVQLYEIDLIIPTCEESFYLSLYKDKIFSLCKVFVDGIKKMDLFHNKHSFIELAGIHKISVPSTNKVSNVTDMHEVTSNVPYNFVVKNVYSRLGEGTLIKPSQEKILKLNFNYNKSYVVQEYIEGNEICSYATSRDGRLLSISMYEPVYRAGHGASVYFSPTVNQNIHDFVEDFVFEHKYTGQISFDFIISKDEKLYVIECNPRTTSGVHLFNRKMNWSSIFGLNGDSPLQKADQLPKMVSLAMMTYGGKYWAKYNFFSDFKKGKDVVFEHKDMLPFVGQFFTSLEFLWVAFKLNITTLNATTYDIEWNSNHKPLIF